MPEACDVSLGDYGGDSPSNYHRSVLTARKPCRCYECGQAVHVGERYERISGRWGREWIVYRFCAACSEIQIEFSSGDRQFGTMWDDFVDNWSEGAHIQACMNRVSTVAAKKKLHEKWLKWKGLDPAVGK